MVPNIYDISYVIAALTFDPLSFYKCLADATRLKTLLLLHRRGELCVCDLTTALQLSQPKVSRHLADLRRCALVGHEKRGKWVYYRLNPDLPGWMIEVLRETAANTPAFLKPCLDNLARAGTSSC